MRADGFSFLVHSVVSGQLLIEEDVTRRPGESEVECLRRLLSHPRLGGRSYESVRLLSDAAATQVPLDDYRRENLVAVYRQVFSDSNVNSSDLAVQILPQLEVVCIYRMPTAVEQALREVFPQATIQCFSACLIEYTRLCSQGVRTSDYGGGHRGSVSFHAVMESNVMHIIAFSHGHLLCANRFPCNNDTDRLYFLLDVWKHLDMDTEFDRCNIYDASDEFVTHLQEFIVSVNAQNLPPLVHL